MRKIFGFSLALALLCLGPAGSSFPISAQEAAKPPQALRYDVAVTLKLVQVYVTDKKGNPVPDLTLGDFSLYDNGQPMTLTGFERHAIAGPGASAAPAAADATVGVTPGPPPQAMNRKFFLFFDFTYNNQRGIVKSKEAALHFLETVVRPEDEVALLSFSMIKGVSIHEYLTTDHRKIREAVSAVNGKKISGRAEDIEQEYWMQAEESLPMLGDNPSPAQANPPRFEWRRQEAKDVVQAYILRLTDLAKALRLVPGQKHFIFFSSGIPTSMIYGNQVGTPTLARQASKFDAGDYVLRTANENMLKELTASNCVMYTFDTRESAKVPSLFDYDEITFASGRRDIFSDQGVFQSTNAAFRDEKTTGLDALKRLSDITGGKYYSNINMYDRNLAQVQSLTGAYYVLGYSIGAQWDGRYHEIRVEVKRRGCEVRAQSGYFNPKPFREYSDLEKQLQLFDLALNERSELQAPASVPLAALLYDSGEAGRLEILSRLPPQALANSSGRDIEFVLVTFDDRDNLVDLERARFDLAKYPEREILFSAGAALAPGDYKCRLVVRDLETGASAVGSTPVHVGARAPVGLVLHSPLLLVPGNGTAFLETRSAKRIMTPAWKDIYAFDRARYCPLVLSVPRDAPAVQAVVPYSVAGLADPAITLSAYLISSSSGERLPVSFYLRNRSRLGTVEVQLLEFSLLRVPSGAYRLYIHAEDAATQARAHTQTKLVVQ